MFGCAGSSLLSGFSLVVASRSCSVAVVHSFSLWRCFLAWDTPISFSCCYSCYLFLSLGTQGNWQELHCFLFAALKNATMAALHQSPECQSQQSGGEPRASHPEYDILILLWQKPYLQKVHSPQFPNSKELGIPWQSSGLGSTQATLHSQKKKKKRKETAKSQGRHKRKCSQCVHPHIICQILSIGV